MMQPKVGFVVGIFFVLLLKLLSVVRDFVQDVKGNGLLVPTKHLKIDTYLYTQLIGAVHLYKVDPFTTTKGFRQCILDIEQMLGEFMGGGELCFDVESKTREYSVLLRAPGAETEVCALQRSIRSLLESICPIATTNSRRSSEAHGHG
jgi:hypothetical protein